MLMPEVAAFGQTAHVQIIMAVGVPEMGAPSADNGGGLPLTRHTPAMQNAIALADHGPKPFANRSYRFDNRTLIRIAHLTESHYPLAVNQSLNPPSMVFHQSFTDSPDYIQSLDRGLQ